MNFTKAQLQAIHEPLRNLQLIACAGSGKTEVVARRIVALLKGVNGRPLAPGNIIAFTFTDKAAGELKDRIVERCREEIGAVVGLAEMYVGTIHGFCLDLLKSEVPRFLKHGVLNEVQQALFIDRRSRQSGLTSCTDLSDKPLKRYRDTLHYIAALSLLREADIVEKALNDCPVVKALEAYRSLLEEHAYLDYSAILEQAVDVLTNDAKLRDRLRDRVKCVVVDEYQDVNPIQEAIVWTLHDLGAKVCVVGDDDQTIYQWRGSDVENILTFKTRYPRVKTVPLEENFRSSEGVIETAHDFIEKNSVRLPKRMKSVDAQRYEPGDLVAQAFDSPAVEAEFIARTVKELRGVPIRENGKQRGISWGDMAVLLRSVRRNGAPIAYALREAGIPYVIIGMNNLFETPEAEASRQMFYLMAGRADVDVDTVAAAWKAARTGANSKRLRRAMEGISRDRDDLLAGKEQRWSLYNIQRQFLRFLEDAEIREETVPEDRGAVLFYNLGKFSQLISDFETIHFYSDPIEKYESFAKFLEHSAAEAYPEGWQDNQYLHPDAVQIMTVHQAKGMQWPVVFLPALIRNRFPAKKHSGRSVWHLLPRAGIEKQERFEGSIEDERRLFYVGMTRSQKYLFFTWAPVPGNQLFQQASEFWEDVLASKYVKRKMQDYSRRRHLAPQPRKGITNAVLTFSDMKYFFECPYQFKLRVLYGFNPPIDEALGYGKSLHDMLAEVHAHATRGEKVGDEVQELIDRHLHVPYAYPELRETLRQSAERVVHNYLSDNRELFDKIEFSEKQIEINMGDGVSVTGRIDLVRRTDTDETTIVDLKSSERVQTEAVTEAQLSIYALGYKELTGKGANYVEIYDLDQRRGKPRSVDEELLADVRKDVLHMADSLRKGDMPVKPAQKRCSRCDFCGMCTAGAAVVSGA